MRHVSFERERGVYGVELTPGVAHIIAAVGDEEQRPASILRLFRLLADAGVPIFLVKLHGSTASFAVEGADIASAEALLQEAGYPLRVRRDLAIATILASSMRDLTGIMVKIADALQLAQARMYGAGDSHSSVQCLIEGYRADAALAQLRAAFGLEAPGG